MRAMLPRRLACGAALLPIRRRCRQRLPPAAKTKIVYTRDIEPPLVERLLYAMAANSR